MKNRSTLLTDRMQEGEGFEVTKRGMTLGHIHVRVPPMSRPREMIVSDHAFQSTHGGLLCVETTDPTSRAIHQCRTPHLCKATSRSAPPNLRWCTWNRRRRLQQRRQSRHQDSMNQTSLQHRRRHTQHREKSQWSCCKEGVGPKNDDPGLPLGFIVIKPRTKSCMILQTKLSLGSQRCTQRMSIPVDEPVAPG